jgi:hypothetical protein
MQFRHIKPIWRKSNSKYTTSNIHGYNMEKGIADIGDAIYQQ